MSEQRSNHICGDPNSACDAECMDLANRAELRTKEETVHRVCQFLREEVGPHVGIEMNCEKCPVNVQTPYGPGTHMCVLRAQELIEIVRSGS